MEYLYLDYLHHLSVHSWEIHSKHFPVSGGEDLKGLEGHEAKLEGRQTMDAPAQELLHLGVPVSVTAPRTAPSTAAIDWRQRRLDAAASASAPAAVAASATRSVMAMEWPGGGGGERRKRQGKRRCRRRQKSTSRSQAKCHRRLQ